MSKTVIATEGLKGRLELVSPTEIYPYDKNAKNHTIEQIEALARIIERDGWDQPIVVDKDYVIVKGHGRRLAALHLGLTKVPVIVRDDMTPKQIRAARVSDNQVALGSFDMDTLNQELREILKMDGDMEITLEDMAFDPSTFELELDDVMLTPAPAQPAAPPQDPPQQEGRDLTKPDLTKELTYKELRQIIVDCESEAQQEEVYNLLSERGLTCRPLTL
jgi:ParB-like chromosome segregation protein Spo0J